MSIAVERLIHITSTLVMTVCFGIMYWQNRTLQGTLALSQSNAEGWRQLSEKHHQATVYLEYQLDIARKHSIPSQYRPQPPFDPNDVVPMLRYEKTP